MLVYSYDAASRLTRLTRQVAGQSGSVATAFSYDNSSRLTGIAHSYSSGSGGSGGSEVSGGSTPSRKGCSPRSRTVARAGCC